MSNGSAKTSNSFQAACAADIGVLDRSEVSQLISHVGAVRALLDSIDIQAARRIRELQAAGQSGPAASLLTNNGHVSGKAARAAAARETVCEAMPVFETALAAGDVSAGHLDALANAGRRLNDEQRLELNDMQDALLAKAGTSSVEQFDRECRDLKNMIQSSTGSDADELDHQRSQCEVKRWVDKSSGMHLSLLKLDPLSDSKLWTAVGHKLVSLRQRNGTSKVPFRQLQAEAFVSAVVDGMDQPSRPSGEPPLPEISVLIDYQTLIDGLHAAGVCETSEGTPVPVSTVRRLCCDATIVPFVLGSDGAVLDAGRTERTANRKQRRALRAMHRTCAHPECAVVFDACRIHHVMWWHKHSGQTDLNNLLPLCEQHHHLVHEGGWTLKLDANRIATWKRPNGTTFHVGPTINRLPKAEPERRSKRKPSESTRLVPLPNVRGQTPTDT